MARCAMTAGGERPRTSGGLWYRSDRRYVQAHVWMCIQRQQWHAYIYVCIRTSLWVGTCLPCAVCGVTLSDCVLSLSLTVCGVTLADCVCGVQAAHKKTFLYLEQLILKHKAHTNSLNIKGQQGGRAPVYSTVHDPASLYIRTWTKCVSQRY